MTYLNERRGDVAVIFAIVAIVISLIAGVIFFLGAGEFRIVIGGVLIAWVGLAILSFFLRKVKFGW